MSKPNGVIARWMSLYNTQGPHSAFADSTPPEAYEKGLLLKMQAEPQHAPKAVPAPLEQDDVLDRTLAAWPMTWNTP